MELHFGGWVRAGSLRAAARRLLHGLFFGGPRDGGGERPVWQPWPL